MPTAPKTIQLPYTYWTDRASAPIVAIVAHNTVGTDSRKYLSQGGPRKVSIHSLIQKDGTLYRYVPDERGANHAGYGKMPPQFPRLNPNRCTIGFELENASDGKGRIDPYTEAQLLTMGWEINRIRAKFGSLPILRHADIDPARRSDTVGLTVEQMEAWAIKAKAHFAAAHTVTAGPHGAIAQEDRRPGALAAKYYAPGTPIVCDDLTSSYWHVADHAGFIPVGQVQA
jgi:N-acetyl-anhydromuramyl-L-alanine amidase AmpD